MLLSLALWAVVLFGPATQRLALGGAYAAIHLILELPSVALSGAVFLFALNVRGRDVAAWIHWAGVAFLAMALIDVSHVLTFPGMPGLFGPPVFQTTIVLWLSSRSVLFLMLLGLAAQPSLGRRAVHPLPPSMVVLLGVGIWGGVLGTIRFWPSLHTVGEGLSALKVGVELVLVALGAVSGVIFVWRGRTAPRGERRQLHWLAAACVAHGLAELAFTRYLTATDLANFVGHLLKTVGDLAVFQALFVAAVRVPNIRVQALRAQKGVLLDAMPDPWLVIDGTGAVLDQRRSEPRAFGLAGDLVGTTLATCLAPAAHGALLAAAEAARRDRAKRELTLEAPGPGLAGVFDVTVVALPKKPRRVDSVLVLVRDVTARRAAEAQLRIADIAFEAPVALVVLDADGTVAQVNRAFQELTGWAPGRVQGQPLTALAATPAEGAAWLDQLATVAQHGRAEARALVRRIDRGPFHAEQSLAAVRALDGGVTHLVMALRDLTEQRAAAQAIHRLAHYDRLTGLANRRLLTEQITGALDEARETGVLGAVIFLDLDHFKTLNDTRGHDVGDRLLRAVALRLTEQVGAFDLVARLGGDEFVVLLRRLHADEEQSAARARAVALELQAVLRAPFELPLSNALGADTLVHHTSPSIGICLFGHDSGGVEELLKRADLAMYQAKDAGRNTLRFFDPSLQARLVERAALAEDLRGARARGELWIAWQPQVDVAGRPIGAEALLRWQHPTRGAVGPAHFIPIAEDTGLIVDIGLWVLESACACLARWAQDPLTRALRLSVNVSARQLYEPDFVHRVQHILTASGAPSGRLVLELTESMVLRGADRAGARLAELVALGIGLSMDDFGTGYSSLALLKRLPLAEVKIDRAFVQSLPGDVDDAAIVHAILGIGRGLHMHVVAEGVETAEQQAFLADAGCVAFQGYRYARPMPLDALEVWIKARSSRGAGGGDGAPLGADAAPGIVDRQPVMG